jgi:hypothetical protein
MGLETEDKGQSDKVLTLDTEKVKKNMEGSRQQRMDSRGANDLEAGGKVSASGGVAVAL